MIDGEPPFGLWGVCACLCEGGGMLHSLDMSLRQVPGEQDPCVLPAVAAGKRGGAGSWANVPLSQT